jgi:hypothetical protein
MECWGRSRPYRGKIQTSSELATGRQKMVSAVSETGGSMVGFLTCSQ